MKEKENSLKEIDTFNWKDFTAKYQKPDTWRGIWQVSNTFIPFLAAWALMYFLLDISYVFTLLIALPAAGLLVRIFIIQHDCGHGSFFKSKSANNLTGTLSSFLTWTPYFYWRKGHGIHHAYSGNLEHRGIGDVYTMTIKEYLEKSKFERLKYRIYRNPLFLFLFIPAVVFVLWYRFPTSRNKALRKVEQNVYWTDLGLVVLIGGVIWLVGLKSFLMVQLPITIIATSVGQWLFFVQHQFPDTFWEHKNSWDYVKAAIQGSSYYKLPKVLQWFSGNIGFHHIHHLNPGIPNYLLERCHKSHPVFQQAPVLKIKSSLSCIRLHLWDEENKKLVGFNAVKKLKVNQFSLDQGSV